jgi:hypothetical protein
MHGRKGRELLEGLCRSRHRHRSVHGSRNQDVGFAVHANVGDVDSDDQYPVESAAHRRAGYLNTRPNVLYIAMTMSSWDTAWSNSADVQRYTMWKREDNPAMFGDQNSESWLRRVALSSP